MRHINIPIFIPHVGCPFTCIFCNQRQIASQLEPLSPSSIPEMVERYLSTIAPGSEIEIAFFGGSFTMMDVSLQEAYLEAARPYLRQGIVSGLRLSTRPDGIDAATLKRLKKRGVTVIELGVQSFDDQVLAAAGRGTTAAQAVDSCWLVKEYGFKLGIQLMVGLPHDERAKDLYSTLVAIRLKPNMVRIYPTLVIAGTVLADHWQQGYYRELPLHEAITIAAQMLLMFQYGGIPVIRMGLQPSQELQSEQTVLAGPYHPAFGELVQQYIFMLQAKEVLHAVQSQPGLHGPINILVNPRDISRMVGQQRSNLKALKQELGLETLKVRPSAEVALDEIALEFPGQIKKLTIKRGEFIRSMIDKGLLPYDAGQL